MLPPSDSIHHANLKLAEVLSSRNQIQVLPPPPAYTAIIPGTTIPITEEALAAYADYDDEEDVEQQSAPAPITINIDASLKIEGHGNTVVVPSGMASPTSPTTPTGTQATSQQAQALRADRITTTVLAALKASGVLDTQNGAGQRPVEISVNAGIVVKGSKNVICAGGVVSKLVKRDQQQQGKASDGPHGVSPTGSRKRRAESVRPSFP